MFARNQRPVLYGGPSIAYLPRRVAERMEILPPVRRGDLHQLLNRRPGTAILVDGLFSSTMAVPPAECRALLEVGWTLVGTASMGALRASELWSVGMIGVGEVFTLYRLGVLNSDADVAVALDPDTLEELTVSNVHIRSMVTSGRASKVVDSLCARKMVCAARDIHFLERTLGMCLDTWRQLGIGDDALETIATLARDPREHPKVRDAHATVDAVLSGLWLGRHPIQMQPNRLANRSGPPLGVAASRGHRWYVCRACQFQVPASAIFCPNCASTAHEMAH